MSALVTYGSGADGIARITLNRPAALNAVNGGMMRDLGSALAAYDADDNARVALLSGAGRAFCAGADVRADPPDGPVALAEDRTRLGELFLQRPRYKPIIAVVHGHAIGMGVHLTLLSEFAICAHSARFRTPEIHYGLNGGTYWWHLQSRAGDAFAMDVVGTGREWSGREAGERGLVTRAVADDALAVQAHELACVVAGQPAAALEGLVETRRSALRQIELTAWQTRARGVGLRHPVATAD